LPADGDAVGPLAELGIREQGALQRAAFTFSARVFGVVVAHAAQDLELDRAVVLQPGRDLGRGVGVGLDERALHEAVRERVEVGDHLLAAVVEPECRLVPIVRQPHRAAGPGARAADLLGLLEQPDLHTRGGCAQCRGQAGRAGAEHDDVIGVGRHGILDSAGLRRRQAMRT